MAENAARHGREVRAFRGTLAGGGFTVVAVVLLVFLMLAQGHCPDRILIEIPFPLFAPFTWWWGNTGWPPMLILLGMSASCKRSAVPWLATAPY